MSSLRDVLECARRDTFVGRTRERDRFAQLLAEPADAPRIVYVHGPQGVGKTSLLGQFARACLEAGIKPVETDLRDAQWERPSRLRATVLAVARRLDATKSRVWILDSCELFGAHFDWFWRAVVPGLSARVLLVVASRRRPADALAADPGWQRALTILPLGELPPKDAAALLAARSVSPAAQASILSAAGGFPFALSYLAGQSWIPSEARFRMEWHDAMAGMGRGLLGEASSRVPGSALIAAALLRRTTEGAIAAVAAGEPDDEPRMGREVLHASAAFDAVADLPYVVSGAGGLSMPAAHREVILSDLRRRDEDRYRRMWRRARAWTLSRVLASDEPDVESVLDYLFSLRHGALTAARPPATADASCAAIDLAPGDAWSVVGAVAEKEGPYEAEAIARWLGAGGARVTAARGARGIEAYLIAAPLAAAYALEALDPVADQIVDHARIRTARAGGTPVSNGPEGGWVVRAVGVCDRETGAIGSTALPAFAAVGRAWTTAFVLRHFLATSQPAVSYLTARAADLVPPPALGFQRVAGVGAGVGEGTVPLWWRSWDIAPAAWLASADGSWCGDDPATPPASMWSRAVFGAAVRQALRSYRRPARLAENPLLRASAVTRRCGGPTTVEARVVALQALLAEEIEALGAASRLSRAHAILARTYLAAEGSQEDVARRLDLPFGTYRYHHDKGIAEIADRLWATETSP